MSRTRKPRPSNPLVAVAYLRVSTAEQHLGPEAQRQAIESWAKARGVTVAAWEDDRDVSGAAAVEDCPGLGRALAGLLAHRAGLLVVARRDRLARDVAKAAIVERLAAQAGARVASAAGEGEGEGPEAQLMRTMVDAFAQYERAVIAFRTRAALQVKKGRGELVGSVPYGFKLGADGVQLEAEPSEATVMLRVRAARAAGHGLRRIARALDAAGLRPRSGKAWHPQQVARIAG